jgi:hypothetical protein
LLGRDDGIAFALWARKRTQGTGHVDRIGTPVSHSSLNGKAD